MGKNTRCVRCQKIVPHYAKNLCKTCYSEDVMKGYITYYRSTERYREQRKAYDFKYLLKQARSEQK